MIEGIFVVGLVAIYLVVYTILDRKFGGEND